MSDSNPTRVRLLEKGQADASLGPLYDRADAVSQGSTLPGPTLFGNQVRALLKLGFVKKIKGSVH